MKTRLLMMLMIVTLGTSQIQESFSEDSATIPSCHVGVFVSDDIQCHIGDSPPCPLPSIEKNGQCVVEKNDICEKGNMLKDGICMPNSGNFRIDDPTFTRQNLLTGKPILDPNPNDFRESGNSIGMLYAYSGLSLVGIILGFFAIKKWKNGK
ncbi:MAG: hypothetical protein GKS07_10165 [Nitrosopumilus sp.]|nr:MAG: hypothetical protein GKS07_10165 [Nitrosopumilus sp.]